MTRAWLHLHLQKGRVKKGESDCQLPHDASLGHICRRMLQAFHFSAVRERKVGLSETGYLATPINARLLEVEPKECEVRFRGKVLQQAPSSNPNGDVT